MYVSQLKLHDSLFGNPKNIFQKKNTKHSFDQQKLQKGRNLRDPEISINKTELKKKIL